MTDKPLRYTLLITGGPTTGRCHARGLGFAQALLNEGHALVRVFFYREAAQVALPLVDSPLDDWRALAAQETTELVVCSASAERYGVSAAPEGCVIAGLGSLLEAGLDSDRVMSFA